MLDLGRIDHANAYRGLVFFFFFSSRRRHTRFKCDWSSDVCSSDLRMAFITDFGVATSQDIIHKELAGTPDYMAPEQLRCEPVVAASDLYSCGVVLYRLLTGELPYRAKSIKEVLEAHLYAAPEPIDRSLNISRPPR